MPTPQYLFQNSRFFENLLEHRFVFELARHLVLRDRPQLLNILRSDIDAFGFDLVLSVGSQTYNVQMKTRSGTPPASPYEIAESIWAVPNGCVIWLRYDPATLDPVSYNLFGMPLPEMSKYNAAKRKGFRRVKMQQANHRNLSIEELAEVLFPRVA